MLDSTFVRLILVVDEFLVIAKIQLRNRSIKSRKWFFFDRGYLFSKYFSAATSLFTLGDHTDLGMKGNGASLSIIGSYPVLENFSVFGQLCGMSVDLGIDESKNVSYSGTDTETLQDGRDSSIYYAFGTKYKLNNWT